MVVEATYVLCTSAARTIEEKEARHREKVTLTFTVNSKIDRDLFTMRKCTCIK
jgi:hypothetical protein